MSDGWLRPYSAGLSLLFLLSAYGWGALLRRPLRSPILRLHSVVCVVGLAVLNFIGGWLNVFGIAKPVVLLALMLLGLIFTVVAVMQSKGKWMALLSPDRRSEFFSALMPVWVALAIGFAACLLLMPSSVFNIHDDFQTYFVRAVRMIQAGSLAGSPWDNTGLDSLGSQTFFHGFFLLTGDVRLLNGFDAVCCFLLALLIIAECAVRWKLPHWLGVLAVIVVMVINPQYVNTSSLYSSVIALLALFIASSLLISQSVSPRPHFWMRTGILLALLASFLAALKLTTAIFAVIYLGCLFMSALAVERNRPNILKAALIVAAATFVFLVPWLLLHWSVALHARNAAAEFSQEASIAALYPSVAAHGIAKLFVASNWMYGDRLYAYYSIMLGCVIMAVIASSVWRRHKQNRRGSLLLAIVSANVATLLTILLFAHQFTVEDAIRYACAIMIASVSLSAMMLMKSARAANAVPSGIVPVASVLILILLLFAPSFTRRVLLADRVHTLVSFPITPAYAEFCERMISRNNALVVRSLQTRVPVGQPILTWIATPFHLDFTRNQLLTVADAGLVNPLISFPAGMSRESLTQYFRKFGVRYVCVQTRGASIKGIDFLKTQLQSEHALHRKLAAYPLYLRETLAVLGAKGKVIYSDDTMMLFELNAP